MPVSFRERITGTLFIISFVVYNIIIYTKKVSLLVIVWKMIKIQETSWNIFWKTYFYQFEKN